MGMPQALSLRMGLCTWNPAAITRPDVLVDAVPPLWRAGVMRYKRSEDMAASALARLTLKQLLLHGGLYHPFAERQIRLHDVSLKPYFEEELVGVHFNLSHSRGVAAAVVATKPVGVDVEHLRSVDLDAVQSTMTAAEWKHIHNHAKPMEAFLHLWSRKEAVLKAVGAGLRMNPGTFEALGNQCYLEGIQWHVTSAMDRGVVHALAVQSPTEVPEIMWYSPEYLLSNAG